MNTNPPNPKDFSNFHDYEKAVKLYEEFLDKTEKVQEIINTTSTEEEFMKEMENLGYTCHEDETCDNPWCQENETCLLLEMDIFQEYCNKYFFWKLLPNNDLIIKPNWINSIDCSILPSNWRKTGSIENNIILWGLNIMEILTEKNTKNLTLSEIYKEKSVQNFGRHVYLLLKEILISDKINKKNLNAVIKFLKNTNIIDKKLAEENIKSLAQAITSK